MELNLKQKIRGQKLTLGSWLTIGHPAVAEIMAKAGFDWLTVDMEHSTLSIREMGDLIRTSDLAGVPAFVRLHSNDAVLVKRALDAGAKGIIAPMINSAAEARALVSSVYYPPKGTRGVGLSRAQGYGTGFKKYWKELPEEIVVVAQVEHIRAVNALEEIFSVEEIDAFLIGPYDLSASLGVPGQFDHPDFVNALERVQTLAREKKKTIGFHLVEPDPKQAQQKIAEGCRFLAYGVDFRFLDFTCRDGLKQIRGGL